MAKVVNMGVRFEFDPANKILMTRLEGELTDELARETDAGMRRHLVEKSPNVHIVDCSSVTKFSMSGEWVRQLARRQPALHSESCRRFFVMPSTADSVWLECSKSLESHTTAPSRSCDRCTRSLQRSPLSRHDLSP